MWEWVPVLSGAVLGVMHLRQALTRRALVVAAITAAIAATTISGEWAYAPHLVLADALRVGVGILASHVALRGWTAYAARPSP